MLLKIYPTVRKILYQHPQTRDDDELLYYYAIVEMGYDPDKITARELLRHIKNGMIPSFKSVFRCRAKAQNLDVKIRGKKYEPRHRKLAPKIEEELHKLKTVNKALARSGLVEQTSLTL